MFLNGGWPVFVIAAVTYMLAVQAGRMTNNRALASSLQGSYLRVYQLFQSPISSLTYDDNYIYPLNYANSIYIIGFRLNPAAQSFFFSCWRCWRRNPGSSESCWSFNARHRRFRVLVTIDNTRRNHRVLSLLTCSTQLTTRMRLVWT